MVSDLSAGWYRIWAIGREIVITDDDKLHSCKVLCDSETEATHMAMRIAMELRIAIKPLWDVLGIDREALPLDIQRLEDRRCNWYRICA